MSAYPLGQTAVCDCGTVFLAASGHDCPFDPSGACDAPATGRAQAPEGLTGVCYDCGAGFLLGLPHECLDGAPGMWPPGGEAA
jgi:hypothetical protein